MVTATVAPSLQLALSKARETKLQEQAGTVWLLKRAGSEVRHGRPDTLGLFGGLLTSRR